MAHLMDQFSILQYLQLHIMIFNRDIDREKSKIKINDSSQKVDFCNNL